jgi:hypothetical protein
MGWDDKISLCGLRAVPVGEGCGVDLLLPMWGAHCAAIPLMCHFNICLFLKNCCYRRNTVVMPAPYLAVLVCARYHSHCLYNVIDQIRTSLWRELSVS